MKAKFYILIAVILTVGVVMVSCKKDDPVPPQSKAEFGADKTTAMVNEEIQFTNSSENATAFKWDFGDGTISTEVSPKKSYSDVGIYVVSLVSTGAGGSTIQNITITIVPAVNFTVEDAENLFTNSPVQFTNTSIGATSYLWKFGDAEDSTSEEENPTFTYSEAGTYSVSLTAISAEGESKLSKDITINATDDIDELYYIDLNAETINRILLDGSGSTATVIDISGQYGPSIAYDDDNEVIYYSDFVDDSTPDGKIWKVNLDGSGMEAIVTGILDPHGIALDKQNQKIYWADQNGNVSRSNLDGSSEELLINVPGGLRAIDLDVANNKMYFYEVYDEIMYSANLDGSNPEAIVTDVYGYGVTVDTQNGKLYFDDQGTATIMRCNLDGSDLTVIYEFPGSTRMYGIVIDYDEGKLYWSDRSEKTISRANLDGTEVEIIGSDLGDPRGIFIKK